MSGGTALQAKAIKIRMPSDYQRTANDFGTKKIAVTTGHAQTEFDKEWGGRMIVLLFLASDGDTCHIGWSRETGREVNSSISATTAGATTNVGWPLRHGVETHRFVPDNDVATQFLIHEGSAAGTLYVSLADG